MAGGRLSSQRAGGLGLPLKLAAAGSSWAPALQLEPPPGGRAWPVFRAGFPLRIALLHACFPLWWIDSASLVALYRQVTRLCKGFTGQKIQGSQAGSG